MQEYAVVENHDAGHIQPLKNSRYVMYPSRFIGAKKNHRRIYMPCRLDVIRPSLGVCSLLIEHKTMTYGGGMGEYASWMLEKER